MKKTLLLLPIWNSGLIFHHGIQYVSATLKELNVENDILMLETTDCLPVLLEMLNDGYDTIAATCTSFEYPALNNLIGKMKEYDTKGRRYWLGGSHVTATAEYGYFDVIHKGAFGDNYSTDYMLGKLPLQKILDSKSGWLSVIVSSGCMYACAYCINSVRRIGKRRMEVQQAINHIRNILKSVSGVKYINFDDDNLADNKEWFKAFLNLYHKEIGIPYIINIRATDINNETAFLLKKTHCYEVQIGVECGDEYVRKYVLNKNISNATIEQAFKICRKYKLRSLAYIMHGIPFTNGNQPLQTAELIKSIQPTLIRDTYFYPWQGSKLYNQCKENNIRIYDISDNYFDISCFTEDNADKTIFRRLIANDYKVCERNLKYLERRN